MTSREAEIQARLDTRVGGDWTRTCDDLAYLLARVATLEAQVAAVRERHIEQFSEWFDESGEPLTDPISVGCSCGSYRYPCRELEALDSAGGGE